MAGYMFQGLCHTRLQDAIDNTFQQKPTEILTSATNTIQVLYLKQSNGTWNVAKHTLSSTGARTVNFSVPAVSPTFATCEDSVGSNDLTSLTAAQGALIGGAIILVWAVAFTVRAIISTLNFNEDRNENE